MARCDIAIVGAGLAGLAAAREVAIHGGDVRVIEAADDVGGRVRTDVVDGFLLDRGFQLYNPAYPEAARVLDHDALALTPLTPGLMVAMGGSRARLGDPRRLPGWTADAASPRTGSLTGKARFARYAWSCSRESIDDVLAREDKPSSVALRAAGIDARLYDRVLRPFLTGVFLESELRTSRHFLDLTLRSFVRGKPSLPARGMRAIPRQLCDALPEGTVALDHRVQRVGTGVVEHDGGTLEARAVIVATDGTDASALVPALTAPRWNSVTTWYFVAPAGTTITDGLGVLVLDGDASGPVINAVALSNALASYAPDTRVLISASVLGVQTGVEHEERVRAHLQHMLSVSTTTWEMIGVYPIGRALPAMLPLFALRRPVSLGDGLFVAGDHRDTSSIQGAMVSGRRAADAALRSLGVKVIE
jgi:glycine/D-amino acid oxidase-like deaminating enzyme